MVRQKEILNSSEETKTGSCNSYGQKQRLATSCLWQDVEREAERLLDIARANEQDSENGRVNQEQDDDRIVDRDETDPYNEVIFGRRRPDSVAIEWTSKTLYILEFKRTSDQRQDYRERGESRARDQHDVLVKSLETVAKKAEGESAGWTVKLIIFVGGTC
jgi:hypothetical protein